MHSIKGGDGIVRETKSESVLIEIGWRLHPYQTNLPCRPNMSSLIAGDENGPYLRTYCPSENLNYQRSDSSTRTISIHGYSHQILGGLVLALEFTVIGS